MRRHDQQQAATAVIVLTILASVLMIVSVQTERAAAYWTAAPLVTPGRFVDMPVGAPALLVGTLEAPAAPGQYAVFVTEYQTCDRDGDCTWREVSRVTPPVRAAGISIENDDYQLGGALWERYAWDRTARVRGIPAGGAVLVAVQRSPTGARAHELYVGSAGSYRTGWTVLVWVLRAAAGVCGVLALVAGWIWWTV